jgi:hypothetical protein
LFKENPSSSVTFNEKEFFLPQTTKTVSLSQTKSIIDVSEIGYLHLQRNENETVPDWTVSSKCNNFFDQNKSVNFTPKLFTDFVNNLGEGITQDIKSVNTITGLMNESNIKELQITNSGKNIIFDIYTTDDTLVSPIFTNSSKIDSYISKYNTFKNEKLTGWVNVGKYNKTDAFNGIGVNREYEKGSFKSNRLRVFLDNKNAGQSSALIIQKLLKLNLVVKQNQEQVSIVKN